MPNELRHRKGAFDDDINFVPDQNEQHRDQEALIGHPVGAIIMHPFTMAWRFFIVFFWILCVVALAAGIIALFGFTHKGHWGDFTGEASGIIQTDCNAITKGWMKTCKDYRINSTIVVGGTDNFIPVIPPFPNGQNIMFGSMSSTYARLQAGFAIGFRLGLQFTFPLFFEPGLAVLIEPFGVHLALPFFAPFGLFVASDDRIKTNVVSMVAEEGLLNMLALIPVEYEYIPEWKENGHFEDGVQHGFIAQQARLVLPQTVRETVVQLGGQTISDFHNLQERKFIPHIVASIQPLYTRLVELENNK